MTRLTEDDPITVDEIMERFSNPPTRIATRHKHHISKVLSVTETDTDSGLNGHVECYCGTTGVVYPDKTVWNNFCRYGYEDCNAEDGYCEECQKEHDY